MPGKIVQETIVPSRAGQSGAGTVTLATITEIDGVPLEEFDEILMYIVSSVNIAGGGSIDFYFQYPVVPNPDVTVDAHWDDHTRGPTTTSGIDQVLSLNRRSYGGTTGTAGASAHARGAQAAATDTSLPYPFPGRQMRIREVVAGAVTTAMTYAIHAIGRRRSF